MNVDMIFNWLMRNCSYYVVERSPEDILMMVKNYDKDPFPLISDVRYVNPFHVSLTDFEFLLGEKYSFKKHGMPLVDAGLINIVGYKHMSAHEAELCDAHTGTVKDYKTNKCFFRFWVGRDSPNIC